MPEPVVSVIVPVHNASLYLSECLDSILGQTFSDLELICIDDGSTDDSPRILCDYQMEDSRVKIINESEKGAAFARNEGFTKARGEYILFLDADDFFRADMIERAVECANASKADVVLFGGKFYDDEKSAYVTEEACLKSILLPSRQTFSREDVSDTLFQIINPAPWTKLIRRSFLESEGIKFQNLPNSNDLYFSYAVISLATTISAIDESFVSYRVQTKSSTQDRKAKDPCCFILACEALGNLLDKRGIFHTLRNSFSKLVVANASYNYRTVNDSLAREKILNKLFDEDCRYMQEAFFRPIDDAQFERYRQEILAYKRESGYAKIVAEVANGEKQGPTFSIILPVYNCEATLKRSVESVLSQDFNDFELIIVDDASTDGTVSAARDLALRDDRIVLLELPVNSKCLRARQMGVGASSGRYVMFLDGDDRYASGALETVAREMEASPADILHFPLETVSPVDGTSLGNNKFFQPYVGTIKGSENILSGCFARGLMNWNLVNKVFRGSVCRAAFKDLIADNIQRGEDLVAFTYLARYAETYRGFDGPPLYVYYFGAGQDGDKPITLSEFRELCASVKASRLIGQLLKKWCEPDEVIRGFEGIERRLLDNCVHKFKEYLTGNEKTEGLDVLFSAWGYQKSLIALMYQYWSQPAVFARAVAETSLVTEERRSIRNIATYYRACEGGGAENVLRQLTNVWLKQGYRVVWLLEVAPADPLVAPAGVEVVIIPAYAGGNAAGYQPRFRKILETLERYEIDVIVYHQWLSDVLLWDMLAAKTKQVNFVIHCHGLFTNQMRFGLYSFSAMPTVYSLADGIVVINPIDKLFWSYFSRAVYQTNNILEDSTGYRSNEPKHSKQVLWLGRLSPEKHPEMAIKIAQNLKNIDPSITLAIAGSAVTDEYERKLQKMAVDGGVADTVKFLGWCDGQRKKDLFAASSVFLMTSEAREGFPLTLLESKAAGIPTVMFDLPYLTVLEDPQGIITVPQNDTMAAALAIFELISDAKLYQQESLKAQASAKEYLCYDQESFWEQLFAEVPTNKHATSNSEVKILWNALLESYPLAIDRWKIENDRLKSENASLKKEDKALKVENAALVKKADAVKRSASWRVGRAITFLPRVAKRTIKRLRKKH